MSQVRHRRLVEPPATGNKVPSVDIFKCWQGKASTVGALRKPQRITLSMQPERVNYKDITTNIMPVRLPRLFGHVFSTVDRRPGRTLDLTCTKHQGCTLLNCKQGQTHNACRRLHRHRLMELKLKRNDASIF